jgi:hypothetical protein
MTHKFDIFGLLLSLSFSLILSTCDNNFDPTKYFKLGSSFDKNQSYLVEKGWMSLNRKKCVKNDNSRKLYTYVDARDPSLAVTFHYNNLCQLAGITTKPRGIEL